MSKPKRHEVEYPMSIIEPKIDVLLDKTDNDRFLLCALASKRAHDINDMMRGQRDRAIQLQTAVEIARAADKKPLSLAFGEVRVGKCPTTPRPSTSRTIKVRSSAGLAASGTCRRRETPKHPTRRLKHSSRAEARFCFARYSGEVRPSRRIRWE